MGHEDPENAAGQASATGLLGRPQRRGAHNPACVLPSGCSGAGAAGALGGRSSSSRTCIRARSRSRAVFSTASMGMGPLAELRERQA